jgi:hypothetical protein
MGAGTGTPQACGGGGDVVEASGAAEETDAEELVAAGEATAVGLGVDWAAGAAVTKGAGEMAAKAGAYLARQEIEGRRLNQLPWQGVGAIWVAVGAVGMTFWCWNYVVRVGWRCEGGVGVSETMGDTREEKGNMCSENVTCQEI